MFARGQFLMNLSPVIIRFPVSISPGKLLRKARLLVTISKSVRHINGLCKTRLQVPHDGICVYEVIPVRPFAREWNYTDLPPLRSPLPVSPRLSSPCNRSLVLLEHGDTFCFNRKDGVNVRTPIAFRRVWRVYVHGIGHYVIQYAYSGRALVVTVVVELNESSVRNVRGQLQRKHRAATRSSKKGNSRRATVIGPGTKSPLQRWLCAVYEAGAMHGSLRDCATVTEICEPLVVELCAAWVQRRRIHCVLCT